MVKSCRLYTCIFTTLSSQLIGHISNENYIKLYVYLSVTRQHTQFASCKSSMHNKETVNQENKTQL